MSALLPLITHQVSGEGMDGVAPWRCAHRGVLWSWPRQRNAEGGLRQQCGAHEKIHSESQIVSLSLSSPPPPSPPSALLSPPSSPSTSSPCIAGLTGSKTSIALKLFGY